MCCSGLLSSLLLDSEGAQLREYTGSGEEPVFGSSSARPVVQLRRITAGDSRDIRQLLQGLPHTSRCRVSTSVSPIPARVLGLRLFCASPKRSVFFFGNISSFHAISQSSGLDLPMYVSRFATSIPGYTGYCQNALTILNHFHLYTFPL